MNESLEILDSTKERVVIAADKIKYVIVGKGENDSFIKVGDVEKQINKITANNIIAELNVVGSEVLFSIGVQFENGGEYFVHKDQVTVLDIDSLIYLCPETSWRLNITLDELITKLGITPTKISDETPA